MKNNKSVPLIKIINQQTVLNLSHPNNSINTNEKNQKSPNDEIFDFDWTEVTYPKKLKHSKTSPNISSKTKTSKTQFDKEYTTANRYASLSHNNDVDLDEIMDKTVITEK